MVKLTWEQCIPPTVTGYVNCDDIVWLNLHGNNAFRPLFALWFICSCGYIPQWKGLQVISFNPFSAKQCLLWCHFLPRPVSETEQVNLIGSLWKLCCAGKCTGEVELQQLEVMLKPSDETRLFRVKKKKKSASGRMESGRTKWLRYPYYIRSLIFIVFQAKHLSKRKQISDTLSLLASTVGVGFKWLILL